MTILYGDRASDFTKNPDQRPSLLSHRPSASVLSWESTSIGPSPRKGPGGREMRTVKTSRGRLTSDDVVRAFQAGTKRTNCICKKICLTILFLKKIYRGRQRRKESTRISQKKMFKPHLDRPQASLQLGWSWPLWRCPVQSLQKQLQLLCHQDRTSANLKERQQDEPKGPEVHGGLETGTWQRSLSTRPPTPSQKDHLA